MNNDFYCEQVLSGKQTVEVVHETADVLAFLHTQPSWQLHIVIIPKQHIASLHQNTDTGIVQKIFAVAQYIILAKQLHNSNYKVIVNGGSYQSSQHLHFHLVSGNPIDDNAVIQKGEMLL